MVGRVQRHPFGREQGVEASEATVGGGAFPTARIPSSAVTLSGDAVAIERRLRAGRIPVVARIAEGRVRLDLRSLPSEDDATLVALVREALS